MAVPRDGRRNGEEGEEGGRALGEGEDLPANRVKHCVIQAPCSRWGGVGKRAKGGGRRGMSGERACRLPRDSRGEVEGVTGQGGVEG